MTTGERLSDIMRAKRVSVRELHRRTSISISGIRRLRRGHLIGNLYTWNAVAKALGVGVDDFLKEGEKVEQ